MAQEEKKIPLLKMSNIEKSFQSVKVLKNVSLELHKGEVLALMGENGAGKSTLMNILMGNYHMDAGEIALEGKPIAIQNPTMALGLGISMIYQELNPILDMTISENIFLNREKTIGHTSFVNKKYVEQETDRLLQQFEVDKKATDKMKELSVAECQMIEIIKAVSYHSKIIIMDEPTSSLSSDEEKKLFSTIHDLKEQGVGIIYISHRMEEIFNIADSVVVLRDGEFITAQKIQNVTRASLIKYMVGRELSDMYPKVECKIGETVLEVKDFNRKNLFHDISFQVKRGEILGISGLVGAGRSEVIKAVFGLDPYDSGQVFLHGKEIKIHNTQDAIQNGIAMVSEDRKAYGLVLCRSINENISLAHMKKFRKGLFLNQKQEKTECEAIANRLNLKRRDMDQPAKDLSGGNQQKVVIAKWMLHQPDVLILDEPTRGIDVGAKAEIYSMMCDLASKGIAIIMISSELPEILGMSDRIIIMHEGRLTGELKRNKATQETILYYALGGKNNE